MRLEDFPLVTVVTLSYQRFKHLYDTVASVMAQDYPRIEYIISDDASPDFPSEAVREFIEKRRGGNIERVQIIRRERNVGTVKNINGAVRQSSGKYILPLSCNDAFYTPHIVSQIVEEFERTGCGLITTTRLLCDDDYRPVCMLPHYLERKRILKCRTPREQYELYVSGKLMDMLSGSSVYYRKSALERYGLFDETYRLLEDAPFFEKFLWENTANFRYDILSIYYESAGILSKKQKNALLREDFLRFRCVQKFSHIDEISPRLRRVLFYERKTSQCSTVPERFLCYLRHWNHALYRFLYRLRRRFYGKLDCCYLKKMRVKLPEYDLDETRG